MSELKTLYNIISINDKCSFVCEGYNGTHFLVSKAHRTEPINGRPLVFKDATAAQDYINCVLDPDLFYVEEFGGNDDLYNNTYSNGGVSLINGHTD